MMGRTYPSPETYRNWEPSRFALINAPLILPENRGSDSMDDELSRAEFPAEAIRQYYNARYELALRVGTFVDTDRNALRHALAHAVLIPEMTLSIVATKINNIGASTDYHHEHHHEHHRDHKKSNDLHWVRALSQAKLECLEDLETQHKILEKRIRWLNYLDSESIHASVALLSEISDLAKDFLDTRQKGPAKITRMMRNALWHMSESTSIEAGSSREVKIYEADEIARLKAYWNTWSAKEDLSAPSAEHFA